MSIETINNYPEEKRWHIRLDSKTSVKITGPRMELILKAAELSGISLSEFCKSAALKEARLTLLEFNQDRVRLAKDILKKEEEKEKKDEMQIPATESKTMQVQ